MHSRNDAGGKKGCNLYIDNTPHVIDDNRIMSLAALQRKQIPKIRVFYGNRLVGPGLALNFFGNHPKIALN